MQSLPGFKRMADSLAVPVVHGPQVGALTDRSVGIWLRTWGEREVKIELSTDAHFAKTVHNQGRSLEKDEYTLTLYLAGLKPDTRYFYRIWVDGQLQPQKHTLRTSVPSGAARSFSLAFGGCAGYIPWHHPMWSTISSRRPQALFLLGDNVYIDYPEEPQVQQYCYYQRSRSRILSKCRPACLFLPFGMTMTLAITMTTAPRH
ncbi:MAG: hypothetical protein HC842_04845 [Cytophagales bacterium]|nr:hypothetical protein [Cytophagales bacterium]